MAIDLEELAEQPLRVSGDSGMVEGHRLSDLIEADKYITSKENAAAGVRSCIKIIRFQPSGSIF